MAGIAPLKAHLVKTTYNERSQPSMVADSSPEVLLIVHAGDSAVYTVPIESYTLFLTRFFMRSWYYCIQNNSQQRQSRGWGRGKERLKGSQ